MAQHRLRVGIGLTIRGDCAVGQAVRDPSHRIRAHRSRPRRYRHSSAKLQSHAAAPEARVWTRSRAPPPPGPPRPRSGLSPPDRRSRRGAANSVVDQMIGRSTLAISRTRRRRGWRAPTITIQRAQHEREDRAAHEHAVPERPCQFLLVVCFIVGPQRLRRSSSGAGPPSRQPSVSTTPRGRGSARPRYHQIPAPPRPSPDVSVLRLADHHRHTFAAPYRATQTKAAFARPLDRQRIDRGRLSPGTTAPRNACPARRLSSSLPSRPCTAGPAGAVDDIDRAPRSPPPAPGLGRTSGVTSRRPCRSDRCPMKRSVTRGNLSGCSIGSVITALCPACRSGALGHFQHPAQPAMGAVIRRWRRS